MCRVKCKSIIYFFTCLIHFVGFFSSNVCMNISLNKELCCNICFINNMFDFMSLVICKDIPNSPLKALIAVFLLAFTVSRNALFSSICRSAK